MWPDRHHLERFPLELIPRRKGFAATPGYRPQYGSCQASSDEAREAFRERWVRRLRHSRFHRLGSDARRERPRNGGLRYRWLRCGPRWYLGARPGILGCPGNWPGSRCAQGSQGPAAALAATDPCGSQHRPRRNGCLRLRGYAHLCSDESGHRDILWIFPLRRTHHGDLDLWRNYAFLVGMEKVATHWIAKLLGPFRSEMIPPLCPRPCRLDLQEAWFNRPSPSPGVPCPRPARLRGMA